MTPEGELRVGLRLAHGRIADVQVASRRPDVARALLQGRTRAEVQAAVPLLFSLCGRSQSTACQLACAAAAGEPPDATALEVARASMAAEMVRETAWQTLLQWPRWLGEAPDPLALAAARGALDYRWGLPEQDPRVRQLAQATWGGPAGDWLQGQTWAALRDWAAAGQTAAARFIQQSMDSPSGADDTLAPALLCNPDDDGLRRLARSADAEAGFCSQPVWHGQPAETGALARLQGDALIGNPIDRPGARAALRFVARLRELASLLAGRSLPAAGTLALGDVGALAWVNNARGLLIHRVALAGERVLRYRIVAPTEWNFHPAGALPRSLRDRPVADPAAATRLTEWLVQSLDPCVTCRIEVDGA